MSALVQEVSPVQPAITRAEAMLKMIEKEPHQAFGAEALVRLLKLPVAKDPQKQAQAISEIGVDLKQFVEAGKLTEVVDGLFKSRLFFDKEQYIEHAFVGGMGNTHYRFISSLFRINIGVLSVFFTKDEKKGDWLVVIKDATIGRDYCMVRSVSDGTHLFGSRLPFEEEKNYWLIAGKYISGEHFTLTLSGNKVALEDNKTLYGTRIDHLTDQGVCRYLEAARAFLKETDRAFQNDMVKRGLFALEQLQNHHTNFDNGFLDMVINSLLVEEV